MRPVLVMMAACVLGACFVAQCGCFTSPKSGYLYVPPPARAWIRVYPKMLQPGTPVIVQTRLLTPAEQCLVDLGPDGMEHARSCAEAASRLWHTTPTLPGLHTITVLVDDHVVLHDTICVLGSEDPEACTP